MCNLSIRKLREKIKSKEYERLPEDTRNNLIENEKTNINDFVKKTIIIKNKYNYEIHSFLECFFVNKYFFNHIF